MTLFKSKHMQNSVCYTLTAKNQTFLETKCASWIEGISKRIKSQLVSVLLIFDGTCKGSGLQAWLIDCQVLLAIWTIRHIYLPQTIIQQCTIRKILFQRT